MPKKGSHYGKYTARIDLRVEPTLKEAWGKVYPPDRWSGKNGARALRTFMRKVFRFVQQSKTPHLTAIAIVEGRYDIVVHGAEYKSPLD